MIMSSIDKVKIMIDQEDIFIIFILDQELIFRKYKNVYKKKKEKWIKVMNRYFI